MKPASHSSSVYPSSFARQMPQLDIGLLVKDMQTAFDKFLSSQQHKEKYFDLETVYSFTTTKKIIDNKLNQISALLTNQRKAVHFEEKKNPLKRQKTEQPDLKPAIKPSVFNSGGLKHIKIVKEALENIDKALNAKTSQTHKKKSNTR